METKTTYDPPVALIAWPRDAEYAEDLRAAGLPRLLMLSATADLCVTTSCKIGFASRRIHSK